MIITTRNMCFSDVENILLSFRDQGWERDKTVLEKYWVEQNEGLRSVIIGEMDGTVAGYATVLKQAVHGPFTDQSIPEITDFNVFKKYQRQGVGSTILDKCEAVAFEQSKTISIGVGLHSGYGAAQRLYVKRGFIPDGSGVWYKNSRLPMKALCHNDDELVLYFSKNKY